MACHEVEILTQGQMHHLHCNYDAQIVILNITSALTENSVRQPCFALQQACEADALTIITKGIKSLDSLSCLGLMLLDTMVHL